MPNKNFLKVLFVKVNDRPEIGVVNETDETYSEIWIDGESFQLEDTDELRHVGSGFFEEPLNSLYHISKSLHKKQTIDMATFYIAGAFSEIDNLSYVEMGNKVLMGYLPNKKTPTYKAFASVYYLKCIGKIGNQSVYTYMSDMVISDSHIKWVGSGIEVENEQTIQHFQNDYKQGQTVYYANEQTLKIQKSIVQGFDTVKGHVIIQTLKGKANGEEELEYFPFTTFMENVHDMPYQAKRFLKKKIAEHKQYFLEEDRWLSILFNRWGNSDYPIAKAERVAMKKVITFKTGERVKTI